MADRFSQPASAFAGVDIARIAEIALRHQEKLRGFHEGAMMALADDDDVSPAELVAVCKWQLATGLGALIHLDDRQSVGEQVSEIASRVLSLGMAR